MKNLVFILLIAILMISLLSCNVEDNDNDYNMNDQIAILPEHTEHTHDHPGSTGCCPCGVCHKHDEEHPNEELSIWTKLFSGFLGIIYLISSLHEILLLIF